jgi:hypothetical protein
MTTRWWRTIPRRHARSINERTERTGATRPLSPIERVNWRNPAAEPMVERWDRRRGGCIKYA